MAAVPDHDRSIERVGYQKCSVGRRVAPEALWLITEWEVSQSFRRSSAVLSIGSAAGHAVQGARAIQICALRSGAPEGEGLCQIEASARGCCGEPGTLSRLRLV